MGSFNTEKQDLPVLENLVETKESGMLPDTHPTGSNPSTSRMKSASPWGRRPLWPVVMWFAWWVACAGPQPRLSDIRQEINTIQWEMDRTAQTQRETQIYRRELLSQLKDLVITESPVILHPQPRSLSPATLPPATIEPPIGLTPKGTSPIPPAATRTTPILPGDPHVSPPKASPPSSPVFSPFQTPPPLQAETGKLFKEAYADYNQRNYQTAAEKFLLSYQYAQDPEQKARSLYWAGESHFRNQDWSNAIHCFTQVEREFPDHPEMPGALLRKGYSYIYLGDSREGARILRELVRRYPTTQEALTAEERLREMG
ncbi:MAG TPA: tetratricopeptide repeat protein [bacterium]|nr:tetratricopeptide repeat protein [bacterium]HOL95738.1 tetratricopeptide repeat protein [bacterium]